MSDSAALQIVTGDGSFRETELNDFIKSSGVGVSGNRYHTVAIMGPQSSGKSTLLNNLFGTGFVEMDAMDGRSQTTQGIWMQRSSKLDEATLIMDLEGSDGRERGEDDTAFEKKTALFAIAVADVLLVNMWCHDIGRESGSGKPLLKTVFEVNMKLFDPRRTVLLFVVRDRSKTPFEKLTEVLREDINKIFDSIPKPDKHQGASLDDFFELKFTSLPNFEVQPEEFVSECAALCGRFVPDSEDALLQGQSGLPGDAFAFSAARIWDVVQDNKDLDLPAHKVMVATVRCGEICAEQLLQLVEGDEWRDLVEAAEEEALQDFGQTAAALIADCLGKYDGDTAYFDETVRAAKRQELREKALRALEPAHAAQLAHARGAALGAFEARLGGAPAASFAEEAKAARAEADASFSTALEAAAVEGAPELGAGGKAEAALAAALDEAAGRALDAQVSALAKAAERAVGAGLGGGVAALLDDSRDLWPALRSLVKQTVEEASGALESGAAGLGLPPARLEGLRARVAAHGRGLVRDRLREAGATAPARLAERFRKAFSLDANKVPRTWGGGEDVPSLASEARAAAADLLAQLAVVRLAEPGGGGAEAAGPGAAAAEAVRALAAEGKGAEGDSARAAALASLLGRGAWGGVPPEDSVLSPPQCAELWRQLVADSGPVVSQALASQEAAARAGGGMPPMWAIAMIVVLGFDELLMVLRNPFLLVLLGVIALFGKAIWQQLNVAENMRLGLVPGLIAIASRVVPAVLSVVAKLAEAAAAKPAEGGAIERGVPAAAAAAAVGAAGSKSPAKSPGKGRSPAPVEGRAGGGGAGAGAGVSEEGLRKRGGGEH